MSPCLDRLLKLAFSLSPPKCPSSLTPLIDVIREMESESFGLSDSLRSLPSSPAPVTYMKIAETSSFSLGIFILHPGSSLPLHDHPDMIGLLKPLLGKIKLESYTLLSREKSLVETVAEGTVILSPASPPQLLLPHSKNLHEVSFYSSHSPSQPYAAFLDYLSPPYASSTSGEYYKVLGEREGKTYLEVCPTPLSYWNNTAYLRHDLKKIVERAEIEHRFRIPPHITS